MRQFSLFYDNYFATTQIKNSSSYFKIEYWRYFERQFWKFEVGLNENETHHLLNWDKTIRHMNKLQWLWWRNISKNPFLSSLFAIISFISLTNINNWKMNSPQFYKHTHKQTNDAECGKQATTERNFVCWSELKMSIQRNMKQRKNIRLLVLILIKFVSNYGIFLDNFLGGSVVSVCISIEKIESKWHAMFSSCSLHNTGIST